MTSRLVPWLAESAAADGGPEGSAQKGLRPREKLDSF